MSKRRIAGYATVRSGYTRDPSRSISGLTAAGRYAGRSNDLFATFPTAPPFNGRSDAPAPNEATSAEPASRTASDRSYAARKFSMNSRSAATNRARRVRRSVSGSRIGFPARRSAASRARPRLSSRVRVSSNHPSRTPQTTRGSATPRNTAFADMSSSRGSVNVTSRWPSQASKTSDPLRVIAYSLRRGSDPGGFETSRMRPSSPRRCSSR